MVKQTRGKKNEILMPNLDELPFDLSVLSEESKLLVSILMYNVSTIQKQFTAEIKEKDTEIRILNEKVTRLEKNLETMESKLDENEVSERDTEIIISGPNIPACTSGENYTNVVKEVFLEHFRTAITNKQIVKSHRVGKKPPHDQFDRRGFIVKLHTKELKNDLLVSSKTYKPTGMFIRENLSPVRNSILFVLRKAKKEFSNVISGCNSINGNVFVWIKAQNGRGQSTATRDSRMLVNTYEALDKVCNEIINRPVASFIPDWQH